MMQQYSDLKKAHPDSVVLFRVGDFYEAFFEDAHTLSRCLDIVLTSVSAGKTVGRVPMAGLPYHSLEGQLRKLVEKGMSVCIADQVEESRGNPLMRREVTRIVTPGTVVEEEMLQADRHNFLASLTVANPEEKMGNILWGLSFCDISTGDFMCAHLAEQDVVEELLRLTPSELLISEDAVELFEAHIQARLLETKFSIRRVAPHPPPAPSKPGHAAATSLLGYLEERYQSKPVLSLQSVKEYSMKGHMVVDDTARKHLELTNTIHGRKYQGSLLWALDRTVTAMGTRRLRDWLMQPLIDIAHIQRRQDGVEELLNDHDGRESLRFHLKQIGDLERIAGRALLGKLSPRDMVLLSRSLVTLPCLQAALVQTTCESLELLRQSHPELLLLGNKIHHLVDDSVAIRLSSSPSAAFLLSKKMRIVPSGRHAELDKLRSLEDTHMEWLKQYENEQKARLGTNALKLGHSKTYGYFLGISKNVVKRLDIPSDYHQQQTLVNEERYTTDVLRNRESAIFESRTNAASLEITVLGELQAEILQSAPDIRTVAGGIATADVLSGLALLALQENYCRPLILQNSREIIVVGGRHPVVEQFATESGGDFVPNSCFLGSAMEKGLDTSKESTEQTHCAKKEPEDDMDEDGSEVGKQMYPDLIILTGPNAAGKSCYLRQVGLIQIMAQIGSFVPATRVRLSICDRVFTRVGSVDDVASGRSTFVMEMNEVASILSSATSRSLVLLDEVGRGTSSSDGACIAQAVVEHISQDIKCRTIFATHYQQLTSLADEVENISNFSMAVSHDGDRLMFLYTVEPVPAYHSHGIEVAKLAGVPLAVVERARELSRQFN